LGKSEIIYTFSKEILNLKVISKVVTEEDLPNQIKELNKRIAELESMMAKLVAPVRQMQKSTQNYFRLVNLALKHGGLSPETLLPEVKDPISKDIIKVLLKKSDQNITQITDSLRDQRGSASRRIVREKLKNLEVMEIVTQNGDKKVPTYKLTEKVLRKWSQLLGINI
jgi:DNA-binding transcriptional ArsR family regulator